MTDWGDLLNLLIRMLNLFCWCVVAEMYWSRPLLPIGRRFVVAVILVGMAVLVVGGLVQFGFPGQAARFLYTAFTAAAAIVAVALISDRR